ncbi:hypothetical protein EEL53_08215 [Muribaculaceae bacterium Isolate-114 (HZI)]|nr:hypothetical protein EEL53_08215 [Muribaculaceae bacterium Isolate-114 (HZI)]
MAAKHPDRKIPRPASRPLETLTKIAAQNPDGYFCKLYLLSRTVVHAQIPKKVSQNSPVLELPLKFTLTVRILEKVGLQHLLVRLTEMSPINSLIATTQVLYEALQ